MSWDPSRVLTLGWKLERMDPVFQRGDGVRGRVFNSIPQIKKQNPWFVARSLYCGYDKPNRRALRLSDSHTHRGPKPKEAKHREIKQAKPNLSHRICLKITA